MNCVIFCQSDTRWEVIQMPAAPLELEKFLLSQLEKSLAPAQLPDPRLQAAIPSPLILPRPPAPAMAPCS